MALTVRRHIGNEFRQTRIYNNLMDDCDTVIRSLARFRVLERNASEQELSAAITDAVTPLARMYSAIKDDQQAPRSVESVRALGRELVALRRNLTGNADPGGAPAAARISIPTEMKGVALLPLSEQAIAMRQRICPVTGRVLGSMGKPILTRVGGRDVYVCCQGCVSALRNSPDKYLSRLRTTAPVRRVPSRNSQQVAIPESMKGIRLLPQAEQVIAMRQRMCPVLNTPLGSMGKPVKVTVNGRSTYVCCQGCVDSVRQNPGRYFR